MFDRLLTKWARRAAWAICAFWLMAAALPVSAQDAAPQKQPEQGVNEDDLFSTDEIQETPPPNTPQGRADDEIFGADDSSIVNIQEKTDASVGDLINQESVSFSGELSAKFGASLLRDYLDGDLDFEDNPYDTSIEGDFLLDIRLREGVKAFGDMWLSYSPQLNESHENATNGEESAAADEPEDFDSEIKELFVDVNIKQKVYFRGGKQTLKWGRGYFWNPTDVINEDRKSFSDMNARLEGTYGLKMHVPFGATYNIYGFANFDNAENLTEIATAGKFEFLLPNDVEMAVSAWQKHGFKPVFGLDFATYKWYTSFRGELSLSNGSNRRKVKADAGGNLVELEQADDWTPRFCFGATKSFDFKNYNDRISVTGEFYYDHDGYDDNLLDENTRAAFLDGGYYQANYYGKYYAALFTTVAKFFSSDVTLNMNAIANVSDSSWLLMPGIVYEITNNATLSLDLTGHFGEDGREYTFGGQAVDLQFRVDLAF